VSTGKFIAALVAVVVAGTGSTIALAVYLGHRIDRLTDRVSTTRTTGPPVRGPVPRPREGE
jgi:hypothetical protein